MSFWLARPVGGAGGCQEGCEAGAEGQGTEHRDRPQGEAELMVRKGQGLQEAEGLGATKDTGAAWGCACGGLGGFASGGQAQAGGKAAWGQAVAVLRRWG